MIIWFSGTGNSEWVAEQLASALGERMVSVAEGLTSGDTHLTLHDGERLGFVFPTYSWLASCGNSVCGKDANQWHTEQLLYGHHLWRRHWTIGAYHGKGVVTPWLHAPKRPLGADAQQLHQHERI